MGAKHKGIFHNRALIASLTWREFQAQYRASIGGMFWAVFQPLFLMAIYTLVFSFFLKVKFSQNESPFDFSINLLCGLLPWIAISEAVSNATGIIQKNVNLAKRVIFPLEILPLTVALTACIKQIIGFLLLIPFAWYVTGRLHWTLAVLPLIILLQLLLTVGINFFVSSVDVYLPDTEQAITFLLPVWLFMTPIFYPADIIPESFDFIVRYNPLASIVSLYRLTVIAGTLPDMSSWLWAAVPSLCVFLLGYLWFMKTRQGFADVL